jgi:predicted DCC family thiol-disulfide oxidoreductase YuxK
MGQPVLLYDGLCGFCDRTVQFILARDAGGPMHFAPLQGDYARQS